MALLLQIAQFRPNDLNGRLVGVFQGRVTDGRTQNVWRKMMASHFHCDNFMNQPNRATTAILTSNQRKDIAVRALGNADSMTALAARHGVSRPLVYTHMHKASTALDGLFSPTRTGDAQEVLFTLPISRKRLFRKNRNSIEEIGALGSGVFQKPDKAANGHMMTLEQNPERVRTDE